MYWIIFLFVLFMINLSVVWFSLHYGISPMPTSFKVKQAMLSLVPITKGNIYELGSGWGTLAFPLAKLCPLCQIYAYEVSLIPYLFSKGRQKIFPFSNLMINRNDFFNVSLEQAEGIICYLYPGAMEKLQKKFDQELKLGSFVITNTFAIPGWQPDKVLEVNDFWRSKLFFYRKT